MRSTPLFLGLMMVSLGFSGALLAAEPVAPTPKPPVNAPTAVMPKPAPTPTAQTIMSPKECVADSGDILCGRLNKGEVRIIAKHGHCRVVENPTKEDFFIPMKTEVEIKAFFAHAAQAGLKLTECK